MASFEVSNKASGLLRLEADWARVAAICKADDIDSEPLRAYLEGSSEHFRLGSLWKTLGVLS